MFAIGSSLAAWGPSFEILLLGRVFQAICTGVALPMVITVLILVFPRERRGSAMGLVGLIIGFAPAVGPALSGMLIDSVGWHVLFLIIAVITVVIIVAALFLLESLGNFKRTRFDVLSVLLSSTGLVSLLYGLSTFSSSDNYAVVAGLVVLGIVLVALFVRRQGKLENPMLQISVLKSRRFASAVGCVVLFQAGFMGLCVLLPLYIQLTLGQSATMSGLATLPGAVLGAVMALVAGKLFDRYGVRKPALVGVFMTLAGAVVFATMGLGSSIVTVVVAFMIVSFGMQLVITPCNTWGLNSLDNSVVQHANALSQTTGQIAASFGTALIISITGLSSAFYTGDDPLVASYTGHHVAFMAVVVVFALMLVLVVLFVRNKATDTIFGQTAREKASYAQVAVAGEQEFSATASRGETFGGSKIAESAMMVQDVMNADPRYVLAHDNIHQAMKLLAETDTSGLPVVDDSGMVKGFVSDGDIIKYLARQDASLTVAGLNLYQFFDDDNIANRIEQLMDLNVMRIATERVIAVTNDMPLEDACRVLAEKRIKKVPVIKDGMLVGALSRRNIVHKIMESVSK